MNQEQNTGDLNHLIRINKDSEAGFLTAAENIRNSELETAFQGYAKQHARFAAELQTEVERLGGSASDEGTVSGALHRGWMDVKSALSGHSAGAILSSCEDGEQSAEVAYLNAADVHLTGQTSALIAKHLEQIKGFRTRLARLVEEIKDGVDFQKNE